MAGIKITERSYAHLTRGDLQALHDGSSKRLHEYFVTGEGKKWTKLYDIKRPLAVALCQGAAMHYVDGTNGVKDFDVWFFYPFKRKHLPYRAIWTWDYTNPRFGRHPSMPDFQGRRVDVLVRSINCPKGGNPIKIICEHLESGQTASAKALRKKAVVMLYPRRFLGRVIWYRQEI